MNRMLRSLSAAALSLTLTAPALAAGMSSFSPSVTYTPFPDVADSAWYAPYVRQAVELGLINGKRRVRPQRQADPGRGHQHGGQDLRHL